MKRAMYYHRDGMPIVSNELMDATMQWALLFEQDRHVANTTTLYGERLSTVFLGLDHSFGEDGPPQIFETMLFAPRSDEQRERQRRALRRAAEACNRSLATGEELELDEDEQLAQYNAWMEKHYPDDQLQLRYSTEEQARDSHNDLVLQCLIPPRWRHRILGKMFGVKAWQRWDDEEEEEWN